MSRHDGMEERGTLNASWPGFAAPWVRYRLVIDGVEVARVSYRKPARVELAVGHHEVQLLGPRGEYRSNVVHVEVVADRRVELYGRAGRFPRGMTGHREISQWAKDNYLWLGAESDSPPTTDYVRPFNGVRLAVHFMALALFSFFAIEAAVHGRWLALAIAVVLAAGSVLLARAELRRRRHAA